MSHINKRINTIIPSYLMQLRMQNLLATQNNPRSISGPRFLCVRRRTRRNLHGYINPDKTTPFSARMLLAKNSRMTSGNSVGQTRLLNRAPVQARQRSHIITIIISPVPRPEEVRKNSQPFLYRQPPFGDYARISRRVKKPNFEERRRRI